MEFLEAFNKWAQAKAASHDEYGYNYYGPTEIVPNYSRKHKWKDGCRFAEATSEPEMENVGEGYCETCYYEFAALTFDGVCTCGQATRYYFRDVPFATLMRELVEIA